MNYWPTIRMLQRLNTYFNLFNLRGKFKTNKKSGRLRSSTYRLDADFAEEHICQFFQPPDHCVGQFSDEYLKLQAISSEMKVTTPEAAVSLFLFHAIDIDRPHESTKKAQAICRRSFVSISVLRCFRELMSAFLDKGRNEGAKQCALLLIGLGSRLSPEEASKPGFAEIADLAHKAVGPLQPITKEKTLDFSDTAHIRGRAVVVVAAPILPGTIEEINRRWQTVTFLVAGRKSDFFIKRYTEEMSTVESSIEEFYIERYAAPYSSSEDELSIITKQCSKELLSHIVNNYLVDLSREEAELLIESFRVYMDDQIFAPAKIPWAIAQAVMTGQANSIIFIGGDSWRITSVELFLGTNKAAVDLWSDRGGRLEARYRRMRLPGEVPGPRAVATVSRILQRLYRGPRSIMRARRATRGLTLLIGRPMDRNYSFEIMKLSEVFHVIGAVVFVPSAIRLTMNIRSAVQQGTFGKNPNWLMFIGSIEAGAREFRSTVRYRALRRLPELALAHYVQNAPDKHAAALCAANTNMRRVLSHSLPGMLVSFGRLRRLLEVKRPDRIVCLPGRDWIARTACLLGQVYNIPSYDIQTVFVGRRSRYVATVATYQVALDTWSADIFSEYFGISREKIILGGGIRLVNDVIELKKNEKKLLFPQRRARVLFASSPEFGQCFPVAQALQELASQNLDVDFSIRLHPALSPQYREVYVRAVTYSGLSNFDISSELNMVKDLSTSQLLITRFSNVGLVAGLAGKPVITCNFSAVSVPISLSDMGLAIEVNSAADLKLLIGTWLAHDSSFDKLGVSQADYLAQNPHLRELNPSEALVNTMLFKEQG